MNSKLLSAKTLDRCPMVRQLFWNDEEGKNSLIYRLKRHAFSRRITLRWTTDGAVVTAPVWSALKPIDDFVFSKKDWLLERIRVQTQEALVHTDRTVPFRGSLARLRLNADQTCFKRDQNGQWWLLMRLPEEAPEDAKLVLMEKTLRSEARVVLQERFKAVSEKVSLKADKWRLSGAKGRWGSCNPRLRSVNLSWRLIACDDELIDYVVAHELAHLIQANHSQAFWSEVEKIDPLYREHERRLKTIRTDLFPGL